MMRGGALWRAFVDTIPNDTGIERTGESRKGKRGRRKRKKGKRTRGRQAVQKRVPVTWGAFCWALLFVFLFFVVRKHPNAKRQRAVIVAGGVTSRHLRSEERSRTPARSCSSASFAVRASCQTAAEHSTLTQPRQEQGREMHGARQRGSKNRASFAEGIPRTRVRPESHMPLHPLLPFRRPATAPSAPVVLPFAQFRRDASWCPRDGSSKVSHQSGGGCGHLYVVLGLSLGLRKVQHGI